MSNPDPLARLAALAALQRERIETQEAAERAKLRATIEARLRRGRRRRRWIGGAAIAVAATTAGIGVAAWRSGQPSRPEGGIVCRAAANPDAEQLVIGPAPDPIAACAEAWAAGIAGDTRVDPSASFVTCIGQGGAIEVFPAPPTICEQLSLAPADSSLDPGTESVADLTTAIIDLNLDGCRTVSEVTAQARVVLDQSGLVGWSVDVSPDSISDGCAKAGVDSATQTIFISVVPAPPESPNPTP